GPAGSQSWHWDVIHPIDLDVFTPAFPLSHITGLRFTATLSQTVFSPLWTNPGCCIGTHRFRTNWIADSATFTVSQGGFPPPLDLTVAGTAFDIVPPAREPATRFSS